MILTKADLAEMDRIARLNLINSITGIKPANLIGTISASGVTNLAIFSSVFHLGSNPALIGMISRPNTEVPRHSLDNLNANGHYTINHLPISQAEQGHYTSAKFAAKESEFEICGFSEGYVEGHLAPYVHESPVSMLMQLKELMPIEINDTVMIIGELIQLIISDESCLERGQVNLEKAGTAGVGGLDTYYKLSKVAQYPYARTTKLPF